MKRNILIVGGTGLVGNTIAQLLKERNQPITIYIGSRKNNTTISNGLIIDVNIPATFKNISENSIRLVVICTNDKANNLLNYCIDNSIDYLDITKATPDLEIAYRLALNRIVNSQIVFSSGWMSSIVTSLVLFAVPNKATINEVSLFIYYSLNDSAGKTSTYFIAENVAKPFRVYCENKPVIAKHFLNSTNHNYSYDIGRRLAYNFDTPDLFILHKIEGIPTVQVKTAYSSKFITRLLNVLQSIQLFKIVPLSIRKVIFSVNGKGDQTLFDVVVKSKDEVKQITVHDILGQAHLTAFSTVLHVETIIKTESKKGVYFSHQLHQPSAFYSQLDSAKAININIKNITE